jgi:drug/metabolite transporter (DMT)-like permease
MNTKIGNIANYLAALILLGMGLTYLFKNSFMPYHSDAISLQWNEVDSSAQFLILALMRAVSGGFIAVAIVTAFLQKKFTSDKITWMPLLILIGGLIVSLASIYATLIVRFNSPGKPPTLLAIIGIFLLIIGYIFNRKSLK